ncbi:MAG: STAS domain-containing protein [gamma proteobacterium symbiont of Bathyaustriella thionipta]|nr:STAS domain-containing protein [gamma proteobacterium symbiont of Bathyaustriella thionipta]
MQVELSERDGYTILAVEGEVDFHCSPDLRKKILQVLDDSGDLILDMGGISYIDSSGVASLVEGLQHARDHKKQFLLANVQDAAMQVLKLTRLDSVFSIHESIDAAINA